LIVFSHGFGGCNTQSTFLMEALAQAGYLVVAPNHSDARCGSARRTGSVLRHPEEPFRSPKLWNENTYHTRHDDIEAVLDAVLAGKKFEGIPVDQKHIGIAGHSLGGYTALGIGGGWPSWRDDRIKAVLALSAFCTPYTVKGDLKHLGVPVMYQGGTRDFGVTPTIKRFSGAYDLSSSPKYYVEFDGAGHFAWTDLNTSSLLSSAIAPLS
jgi:predicted dienelactone hydrolase